jgi:hypothetical protein
VIAGLVAAVAVLGPVALFQPAEGAWSDSESASGTVTAAPGLPSPILRSCDYTPGLIGIASKVTVIWSWPSGYGTMSPSNAAFAASAGGLLNLGSLLGGTTSTTPQSGPGPYTTTYTTVQLGLLSSGITIGVKAVSGGGWESPYATASATGSIVGVNAKCVVNPPPG